MLSGVLVSSSGEIVLGGLKAKCLRYCTGSPSILRLYRNRQWGRLEAWATFSVEEFRGLGRLIVRIDKESILQPTWIWLMMYQGSPFDHTLAVITWVKTPLLKPPQLFSTIELKITHLCHFQTPQVAARGAPSFWVSLGLTAQDPWSHIWYSSKLLWICDFSTVEIWWNMRPWSFCSKKPSF